MHRAGVATEHDKVLPADPGEEIHYSGHVLDGTGRSDVMNSDRPGKPGRFELIGTAAGWAWSMRTSRWIADQRAGSGKNQQSLSSVSSLRGSETLKKILLFVP